MSAPDFDSERLERAVAALGLSPLVDAATATPVYLVGGAVRDILLGRPREGADVDVAVEGDAIAIARRLGVEVREHERFGTASVALGDLGVDLASTRSETYSAPGALPDVAAADLDADLARRDFTVNAMAVPIAEPSRLIDPHGGLADLEAGLIRVLHRGSFTDDPTRALRAARYAARFGFGLEPETEVQLREAQIASVSAERVEAELLRLAAEPRWRNGFELLEAWGLVAGADLELMATVRELLESGPPWSDAAMPEATMLLAGHPSSGTFSPRPEPLRCARELAAIEPGPPSALALAARDVAPASLVIARALGAGWLDAFMAKWRDVRLEIDGEDLLSAGVEQGPAIGRGLAKALAARLDGEVSGREDELRLALAAARAEPGAG